MKEDQGRARDGVAASGRAVQTPPQPPFYQCILKAVGFFTMIR
jgi:hypothetical protein